MYRFWRIWYSVQNWLQGAILEVKWWSRAALDWLTSYVAYKLVVLIAFAGGISCGVLFLHTAHPHGVTQWIFALILMVVVEIGGLAMSAIAGAALVFGSLALANKLRRKAVH